MPDIMMNLVLAFDFLPSVWVALCYDDFS